MIAAKTVDGLYLTPVEKVHALNAFSTGDQHNSKQPSFETIITALLYPKNQSMDASEDFQSTFETYNAKGIPSFYSVPKSITNFKC